MALRLPSTAALLQSLLPAAHAPLRAAPAFAVPVLQRLQQPLFPSISLPNPFAPIANIPSLLEELWDGLLRAVPKNKTSHAKTRSRQMAGKALKDVTELNRCSGCGRMKRAHLLCPFCVQAIKEFMKGRTPEKEMSSTSSKK